MSAGRSLRRRSGARGYYASKAEQRQEMTYASDSDRITERLALSRGRSSGWRARASTSMSIQGKSGSEVRRSWRSEASAACQIATLACLPGILQIRTMLPASCSASPPGQLPICEVVAGVVGHLRGEVNLDADEELHHSPLVRPVARSALRTMMSRYALKDVVNRSAGADTPNVYGLPPPSSGTARQQRPRLNSSRSVA